MADAQPEGKVYVSGVQADSRMKDYFCGGKFTINLKF